MSTGRDRGRPGRGRGFEDEARRAAAEARRAGADELRRAGDELRAAGQEMKRQANELRNQRHDARNPESQPIWARPEPGARRAKLSRDEIAAAALRIADDEGIEAVSMRRVASALGVGTMSLYYYVRTKAELVDLMSDAMMGQVLIPEDEFPVDWRDALEMIANRSRDAFSRHPWALDPTPTTPGPNGMRHFEQSIRAVSGLDIDVTNQLEVISLVEDYVFGFILRQAMDQKEHDASDEAHKNAMAAWFDTQMATGEFPYTEAAVGGDDARTVIERLMALGIDENRFARGLRRLLDGIALDLERRSPGSAA